MNINIDQISRYLLHEFLHVFLRVFLFFAILLCCVEWFRQLRFADPNYQGLQIFYYVLLMIPRNLAKAGPLMALFMSLAVGWRLSQTSELIAIRALGFSLRSLLSVVLSISIACAAVLFISNEYVAPKTTAIARNFRADHLGQRYAMIKGRGLWIKLDKAFVHVLSKGFKQPVEIYDVDDHWHILQITHADNIHSIGQNKWRLEGVKSTVFDTTKVRHVEEKERIWMAPINPELLHLLKLDLRFSHLKQLRVYLKKVPHTWRTWDYRAARYFLGYRLLQPFLFIGLVVFVFLMLLLPIVTRDRFWLFVTPLGLGMFIYLCFELSFPMMKVFHWSPWGVLAVPLSALLAAIAFVGYKVRDR